MTPASASGRRVVLVGDVRRVRAVLALYVALHRGRTATLGDLRVALERMNDDAATEGWPA